MVSDRELLNEWLKFLSKTNADLPHIRGHLRDHLGAWTAERRHNAAIHLLDCVKTHKAKNHWGRCRVGILLALELDPGVLRHIDRFQLLVSLIGQQSVAPLLRLFDNETTTDLTATHPSLSTRLKTYSHLSEIRNLLFRLSQRYDRLLRERPPGFIKAALAVADTLFLLEASEQTIEGMSEFLPTIDVNLEGPEAVAELLSSFIAEALERKAAGEREGSVAVSEILSLPSFREVVSLAGLRFIYREWVKHVTVLGYNIDHRSPDLRTVYCLTAPTPEYESAVRQSYVFTDLQRSVLSLVPYPHDQPALSMQDVISVLTRAMGTQVCRYVARPFPRYVAKIPFDANFFKEFIDVPYIEDIAQKRDEVNELVLSDELLSTIKFTQNLGIVSYGRLFRTLRAFSLLHTHALFGQAVVEAVPALNGLIPVLHRAELLNLLSVSGETPETIADFVDAVSIRIDANQRNFIDVQYRPLLQMGEVFIISPRLVIRSGTTRNALAATRKRVTSAGPWFENYVGHLMAGRYLNVARSKKIKINGEQAECDVAVLIGTSLLLLECKHSLHAVSAHEQRDLWEDVAKGTEQLARMRRMLLLDPALPERLQKWFPNAEKPSCTQILCAVITSTRAFAGFSIDGISIRDIFSLRNLFLNGGIELGALDGEKMVGYELRYWKQEHFTDGDLFDYLSDDGLFWKSRRVFAAPATYLDFATDKVVLARQTYVTQFPNDIRLIRETLKTLGLSETGEITRSVRHPMMVRDLTKRFEGTEEE